MSQAPRVILHVFPSKSWGGAEIYSVQIAKAQQEAGENVFFWAQPNTPIFEEATKKGLKLIAKPLGYRIDLSIIKLNAVIRENKATHVHLHWSGGMWSFGIARMFGNFKLIYQVHLWMKHSKKDPLHWLLYKSLDTVIVAGEKAKQAATRFLPIEKHKIQICPYAITQGDVRPISKEGLGFAPKDLVVGIFSRLDRQKGILEFLKAFQALLPQFPNVKSIIVGEPTKGEEDSFQYHEEIQKFVSDNSLGSPNNFVQLHGFKKNFRDWLATCDVLIVPSYHESYSLIILEAFALGIPVLSTAAGGTPDLIHNERGWLVEPRNVESLKEGLRQIFSLPHQIPAMGLMAKNYVDQVHTFPIVLKRLNDIYDDA